MRASKFWLTLGYSISSNLGSRQEFHLFNAHRRAALTGPGWEMKPRMLEVTRQHRNKELAFGDRPFTPPPRLSWRRKAAPRARLPRPCRGGEDQPGPGKGRGGCSDAAGRDSRGAGRQTGKKVGAMGRLRASRGSGSIWKPRPGLGAQRTPTLGSATPSRVG